MANKKPPIPVDPRFRGATPERLAQALKRRKPKQKKTATKSGESTENV